MYAMFFFSNSCSTVSWEVVSKNIRHWSEMGFQMQEHCFFKCEKQNHGFYYDTFSQRSNSKKIVFSLKKMQVHDMKWLFSTYNVCGNSLNLRRLLGKARLRGVLCSRLSGKKLIFPDMCIYLRRWLKASQGQKKK